jgi:5-methylcytosine-specific restriction endonuclease McrA
MKQGGFALTYSVNHRRTRGVSKILVRFEPRFWTSLLASRAGLDGVGLFVRCAHYAAEWGHVDGRLPVLPVSLKDRPSLRALDAAMRAGLIARDGTDYVLRERGVLWSFVNPTPIPPNLRPRLVAAIMERDGSGCAYCGRADPVTLDHVVPRSQGGSNDVSNLVLACAPCNSAKGQRTPEQWSAAGGPP